MKDYAADSSFKEIELVERKRIKSDVCYDIYLKHVSSLTYAPDTYKVAKNGCFINKDFASPDEAREYIKEVA